MQNERSATRPAAIAFIFVTVVLDVVAMGIVIPVLPKLVENFMHGDTANAASIYGVFATVGAFIAFIFSPIIGALSDRFGRRKVILLANFGLGLDYIVMALAPTLSWLFLGRVISGITGATWTTAGAYIADVTPQEKRASGFGLLGAAFGLGFVLGPALGGVLGAVDPRLPFWAAAGLTLVNALYGLLVLPESLPPEKRRSFAWSRANPVGSLALVGVCTMIVQGALVKPVVAQLGERRSVLIGLAFGTVSFTIWGLAPTGRLALIAIPFGALMGLYGPAAQGLMSRRVSASEQGQLQGALGSIMGITFMIAPGLFTQVFSHAIGAERDWNLPGAPLLLASLLTVGALALAWRVTRNA